MKRIYRFSLLTALLFLTACRISFLAADQLPWIGESPILFKDDFSTQSGGWSTHVDASSFSGYSRGGFRLWADIPNYQFWSIPGLNFKDVLINTHATKLSGPDDNYFGVICRYQDPENFYALVIGSDGYYGIFKMLQGRFELIERPVMDYSDDIQPGNTTNEIRALCQGNQLVLLVNETKLIEVTDNSLAFGDVGLIAGNFAEPGVDVLFDYFIVAKP